MTEEAILAVSMLLVATEKDSSLRTTFTFYLLGVLKVFPYWKPHILFKQNNFIESIVSRIVKCLNSETESAFFSVMKGFVDYSLDEATDLEYYGNMTSFFFRGLLHETTSSSLSPNCVSKLIFETLRLITSEIYDLRSFLPEAPVGTRLNELLRKYFILPASALASTFHALRHLKESNEAFDAKLLDFETFSNVLLTYLSSISSFLSNCEAHEAELASLLKLILKMLKVIVTLNSGSIEGTFTIVHLVVQSRINFKNASNYREILSDSCQLLLECAKIKCSLIQSALICFRDAVISLDFIDPAQDKTNGEVNYYETAASIGPYIGALFRLQLDINQDRTVCDGILNSLLSSVPNEGQNEISTVILTRESSDKLACPHAIATLGHVAGVSGDEQIALTCLANLTAQFNKGNYGELSRIFFTQFNLIAVTGSGSLLANILDIYTNIIAEGELSLVSIAMDELGKSLVSLCKNEMIKMEVLLFTLMRSFIEKGLLLAKKRHSHLHLNSQKPAHNPIGTLRPVLFAIWMILEYVVVEDFINKAASIDLFQEFWFVLIFHGYQSQLSWDPLWKEFIPRIAERSPLLIKEKDRVQTASTFSLSLLTQHINSALKSHLITLMPNCTNSAKNLSLAQCLWLLTFYQCESQKLEAGRTDTFMAYLKSDVVYYLDLYPFIEDLSLTVRIEYLLSFVNIVLDFKGLVNRKHD